MRGPIYKHIVVRVPAALHKKVKSYCSEKGVAISALVREYMESLKNSKDPSSDK